MSQAEQWQFIASEAAQMGAKDEAIRKWRERGKVPHRWRLPLLEKAKSKRVKLDKQIFDNIPDTPERLVPRYGTT